MDSAGGKITDGFYFIEGTHPCPVHQIDNLFAVQLRKAHFLFLLPATNRYYHREEIFPCFSGPGLPLTGKRPLMPLVKFAMLFRMTDTPVLTDVKNEGLAQKNGAGHKV